MNFIFQIAEHENIRNKQKQNLSAFINEEKNASRLIPSEYLQKRNRCLKKSKCEYKIKSRPVKPMFWGKESQIY